MSTLVFSAVTTKGKADVDYLRGIEDRLVRMDEDLKDCRRDSARLREENFDLMRRVLALENGK